MYKKFILPSLLITSTLAFAQPAFAANEYTINNPYWQANYISGLSNASLGYDCSYRNSDGSFSNSRALYTSWQHQGYGFPGLQHNTVCMIALRGENNDLIPKLQGGSLVAVTMRANVNFGNSSYYPQMLDEELIVYNGGTNKKNSNSRNYLFPVSQLHSESGITTEIQGQGRAYTTTTILFMVASTSGTSDWTQLYVNLTLPDVGSSTNFAVTQMTYYKDVNAVYEDLLNQQLQTNKDILTILEDISQNSSMEGMIAEQQKTNNLIEQQTEQQKQQYEQEKAEEQQREQQQYEQNDDVGGIFNFGLQDPLSQLWNMFSPSCSVDIPIISGWLHAPTTKFNSWWCNSSGSTIRSVSTPTFSIVSVMLVFGFFVKWLKGKEENN